MRFQATDNRGTAYWANDPNEAGAMALDASHSSKRETLVCVERETDAGNPYLVPVGWLDRETAKRWRAEQ